jgi:hypothetical protein
MKMPIVLAFALVALLPCLCVMLQSTAQQNMDAIEDEICIFDSQTAGAVEDMLPDPLPIEQPPAKEAKRRRILFSLVSSLRKSKFRKRKRGDSNQHFNIEM